MFWPLCAPLHPQLFWLSDSFGVETTEVICLAAVEMCELSETEWASPLALNWLRSPWHAGPATAGLCLSLPAGVTDSDTYPLLVVIVCTNGVHIAIFTRNPSNDSNTDTY